jgi:hypothetical protein
VRKPPHCDEASEGAGQQKNSVLSENSNTFLGAGAAFRFRNCRLHGSHGREAHRACPGDWFRCGRIRASPGASVPLRDRGCGSCAPPWIRGRPTRTSPKREKLERTCCLRRQTSLSRKESRAARASGTCLRQSSLPPANIEVLGVASSVAEWRCRHMYMYVYNIRTPRCTDSKRPSENISEKE